MQIKLGLSEYENMDQLDGRRVGALVHSDADAEALLNKRSRWLRKLGWGFFAGLSLCIGLAHLVPNVSSLQIVAMLSGLLALCSGAAWVSYKLEDSQAAPLSVYPHLCEELASLTEQSPAVLKYVQKVNAKGRQLRLFDIACANAVYAAEQSEKREARGSACAILHSL